MLKRIIFAFFLLVPSFLRAGNQTDPFYALVTSSSKGTEEFFDSHYPKIDKNLKYLFLVPNVNYQKQFGAGTFVYQGDTLGASYDLANLADFLDAGPADRARDVKRRFVKTLFVTSALSDLIDYFCLNKVLLVQQEEEALIDQLAPQIVFDDLTSPVNRAMIKAISLKATEERKVEVTQMGLLELEKKLLAYGIDVAKLPVQVDLKSLNVADLVAGCDSQNSLPKFDLKGLAAEWSGELKGKDGTVPLPLEIGISVQKQVSNESTWGAFTASTSWGSLVDQQQRAYGNKLEEWDLVGFMQNLSKPTGLVGYQEEMEKRYKGMATGAELVRRYRHRILERSRKSEEISKDDMESVQDIYSVIQGAEESGWILLKAKLLGR